MQIGNCTALHTRTSEGDAFVLVRSTSNVLALWDAIRQIGLKIGIFTYSGLSSYSWAYAVEGHLLVAPMAHILRNVANTDFVDFVSFTRSDGSICDIDYLSFPRDKLYPADITEEFPEFRFNKYAIYHAEYEGGYAFTTQVPGEFRHRRSETVTQNYVREYFLSRAEAVSDMPDIDEIHPPEREIGGQVRQRVMWQIVYPALLLGQFAGPNTVTPHYRISAFLSEFDNVRPRTNALQYTFFVSNQTMYERINKIQLYDTKFLAWYPTYIAVGRNRLLTEIDRPSLNSYVDVDLSNITPEAITAPDGFQYFGLSLGLTATPLRSFTGQVKAELELDGTTITLIDQSAF